ncbi:hypothetical protein H8959_009674, partial [Pygathrix nigripes]
MPHRASVEIGKSVKGTNKAKCQLLCSDDKDGLYFLSGSVVVRIKGDKVVLQKLLLCVILFYTVYYVSLSMGCVLFEVHELDVLAPFDFKTNPSWLNINYKVLLVSTEVTYFVCGLLFVPVVEEWVWDYAISVTILHVVITSTVMLEFPLTSH